ncbi:MAG: hypothetical protein R6X34_18825 [Chloroflexota bacterium]
MRKFIFSIFLAFLLGAATFGLIQTVFGQGDGSATAARLSGVTSTPIPFAPARHPA